MKKIILLFIGLFFCPNQTLPKELKIDSIPKQLEMCQTGLFPSHLSRPPMTLKMANELVKLPLWCVQMEYPHSVHYPISSFGELARPSVNHPAFCGCFDWHSAVHAHWSLVTLLKQFPNLGQAEKVRHILKTSLSARNIKAEVGFLKREEDFERPYGWAWLLKLSTALHNWNDPLAVKLEKNLKPLTNLIVQYFRGFLPTLPYPLRSGRYKNTAFAMALAFDYAKATGKTGFTKIIKQYAKKFYLNDKACPLSYEPSGFDFLSPCLSEMALMRRVLKENHFKTWLAGFLPQLENENFSMKVGQVKDKKDGESVHLDGLNLSRAWMLFGLSNQYPKDYGHLAPIARKNLGLAVQSLKNNSYTVQHWLISFLIYALNSSG